MKSVYDEVGSLDKRCYEKFFLTEDILMEHAALSMATFIENSFEVKSRVIIVSGVGNNGADGIVLARLLYKKFDVKLYLPFDVKSKMAKLQLERLNTICDVRTEKLGSCDIVVDCLFGSGLNKPLEKPAQEVINQMNSMDAYKLACDVPSGVDSSGYVDTIAFYANKTITMGALKKSLLSDIAKDFVGCIEVANLGVQREVYETSTNTFLLEKSDLNLPFRNQKNSHKGSFGHAAIIVGDKDGASKIACDAAFSFGAGLVTAVSHLKTDVEANIMQSHFIPKNCTAVGIGMGLGNFEEKEIEQILKSDLPKVVDADLFYEKVVLNALNENSVLTPHPKEFCSLLKISQICDIDITELQKNRFKYVKLFMEKYPNTTLLLKGANVIIANQDKIYINSFGSAVLSKGGSGDVLSGLITSLLAQGYKPLDAAISASLAHTLSANAFGKNSYALKPQDIIEGVKTL